MVLHMKCTLGMLIWVNHMTYQLVDFQLRTVWHFQCWLTLRMSHRQSLWCRFATSAHSLKHNRFSQSRRWWLYPEQLNLMWYQWWQSSQAHTCCTDWSQPHLQTAGQTTVSCKPYMHLTCTKYKYVQLRLGVGTSARWFAGAVPQGCMPSTSLLMQQISQNANCKAITCNLCLLEIHLMASIVPI